MRLCLLTTALLISSVASAVDFGTHQWAGKRITTCKIDLSQERLHLFLKDAEGRPFNRMERLASWLHSRGQKLPFAMNAGMYHGDFSPVGLFIAEGVQISPLNTASAPGNFFLKPNGVFLVTDRGAAIVETSQYSQVRDKVILANQSGPLLVLNGTLHPAFKKASTNRLIRNGVGVVSSRVVVFAISEEPVNFFEFATFFRDTLHCQNALFLDGTVSSLHAPGLKRSDFRMDLGPIVGVVE